MAVHLNAGLKTRFIPTLFIIALLLTVSGALARASSESEPAADPGAGGAPDSTASARADEPSSDELREVMSESVDPQRIDRRPGFSTTVVDAQAGEQPSNPNPNGVRISAQGHYLDFNADSAESAEPEDQR